MDHITRAAWRAYRDVRTRLYGRGAQISFEDADKAMLLRLNDGWVATRISNEASGQAEMEVNVLCQSGVKESVLTDTVRFVVLGGRRYEKRTYDPPLEIPHRHLLRIRPIGETA